MAVRAAARWKPDVERDRRQRDWRRYEVEIEASGRAAAAFMTLGEATARLRMEPIACACVGGTSCCRFRGAQSAALHRAAHIAVKLMAERATLTERTM